MSQDQPENGRWKWVKDIIVPTLVAVVALAGTFLGSLQANNSSRETQRNQFNEERVKADRDRRADVYLKFLAAAYTYHSKLVSLVSACPPFPDVLPNRSAEDHNKAVGIHHLCVTQEEAKATTEAEAFRSAQNEVYIFGSDEASDIAQELGRAFPDSVSPGRKPLAPGEIPAYIGRADFGDPYAEFQKMACREIPATPRSKC